jgi:hypothetical protein
MWRTGAQPVVECLVTRDGGVVEGASMSKAWMMAVLAAATVTACGIQRSERAEVAQTQLVGMTKEKILSCMGPPQRSAAVGATEVWTYGSGGQSVGVASAVSGSNVASAVGVSAFRYCVVDVVMRNDVVERVNYSGRAGGLLSPHAECSYAVENCLH